MQYFSNYISLHPVGREGAIGYRTVTTVERPYKLSPSEPGGSKVGQVIAAIDVGTSKICVLVGEQNRQGLHIVGVGSVPSRGLHRGVVVNVQEAARAIEAAVKRAERLSGKTITSAYVSISGQHLESDNSRSVVAISPAHRDITREDIHRALEAARARAIPSNREVLQIIPRTYIVDGQGGITNPISMSGVRLEMDAHLISCSVRSIRNLVKSVGSAGDVEVAGLVPGALAASEAVLEDADRELGIMLIDSGAGTTDIALFAHGAIQWSAVVPVGGNLITNDIALGLRLPFEVAEQLKCTYGHVDPSLIDEQEMIDLASYLPNSNDLVARKTIAEIIQARVEELFGLVERELVRSGYEGMLPGGVVLTGGSSTLPGIAPVAEEILDVPIRLAAPAGLHGLTDSICHPAYTAAVGLLLWAVREISQMDVDDEREVVEMVQEEEQGAVSRLKRLFRWLF